MTRNTALVTRCNICNAVVCIHSETSYRFFGPAGIYADIGEMALAHETGAHTAERERVTYTTAWQPWEYGDLERVAGYEGRARMEPKAKRTPSRLKVRYLGSGTALLACDLEAECSGPDQEHKHNAAKVYWPLRREERDGKLSGYLVPASHDAICPVCGTEYSLAEWAKADDEYFLRVADTLLKTDDKEPDA